MKYLKYPLKNIIYEKLLQEDNIFDKDLLSDLGKTNYELSMQDLNNTLLHMEIMGLITVRWVGKDKRRIEPVRKTIKEEE